MTSRYWFALPALAAVACGDDYSLDVVVEQPPGVTIARTELSVFEGAVTCDAIRFGDVTDEELAPALVDRETVIEGGAPSAALAGLSRRDRKVLVARAFGPDQSLVAAGCVEVGEVTGAQTVTVPTELAARASVGFVDRVEAPTAIRVVTTGPDGLPLDGREVSWRVFAAAGATPARATGVIAEDDAWSAAAPSCTAGGVATIHPVPPGTTGGYAIQPRIAWSLARPPLLTSINVDPVPSQRGVITGVRHPCAIGRGVGGARLVCLTDATTVSAFPVDATGALGAAATTALAFAPIGLYAAPDAGDDAVFAISASGDLARVFPSLEPRTCATCGLGGIDDVIAVPACGGAGAKAIVHTAGAVELRWVDAGGGAMTGFPLDLAPGTTTELRATGCATVIDAVTGARTSVGVTALEARVGSTPVRARLAFDCTAAGCAEQGLPLTEAGVGFTRDALPAMLLPGIDASGVVVVRAVFVRGTDGVELLELSRQSAAGTPTRIITAQLDDDGHADTLWETAAGPLPILQVAYAREVQGAPLSAIGILQHAIENELLDLLAADLSGDGLDDVVLVTRSTLNDKLGLVVIASGAASGVVAPEDPTCP